VLRRLAGRQAARAPQEAEASAPPQPETAPR
jgi:hypothetical protein